MKRIDMLVTGPHFFTMEGAGVGYRAHWGLGVDRAVVFFRPPQPDGSLSLVLAVANAAIVVSNSLAVLQALDLIRSRAEGVQTGMADVRDRLDRLAKQNRQLVSIVRFRGGGADLGSCPSVFACSGRV